MSDTNTPQESPPQAPAPGKEAQGIKIERIQLHEKFLITTPPMREIIQDAQTAGMAQEVEELLDITSEGLILGMKPAGTVSLAAVSVATCLVVSQLSFRGIVDNQGVMRLQTQVQVFAQQLQAVMGIIQAMQKGGDGGRGPRIVHP